MLLHGPSAVAVEVVGMMLLELWPGLWLLLHAAVTKVLLLLLELLLADHGLRVGDRLAVGEILCK